MLIITIDKEEFVWDSCEYNSYELLKNYFIVKKDEQWVGCYYIALAHTFRFEVRNEIIKENN